MTSTNLEKYKDYLIARGQSINYYTTIRVLLKYCEANNIDDAKITQEQITNLFLSDANYSNSSKNQFIKAGRHYARFLGQETSVWHQMKLLAVERRIPNYLTEQDLEGAKNSLITYHSDLMQIPKIRALLDFLFYSGARKSELLNLKRKDIDIKERIAKVYGKGQKERIIYFPESVAKTLKIYFACEEEGINAFNITVHQLTYMMRLMTKATGRKIYTHLWRHSGARYMIRKGIPIGVVSKILGHSSLNTTIIYTDPDQKMIADMYKECIDDKS